MISTWEEMHFWKTGEWQVIEERLDDLDAAGTVYNPTRDKLFASLTATPFDQVKAVIVGQDPYPKAKHATGIAFSIPPEEKEIPPTLVNIMNVYSKDLHYPYLKNGDLTPWTKEGVLLWNAIPTTEEGKSLAHEGWVEWKYLTQEILERLSEKGNIVFAFCGRVARSFVNCIDTEINEVIETSHPSPRGSLNSRTPFLHSRLFSTINSKLLEMRMPLINWRIE